MNVEFLKKTMAKIMILASVFVCSFCINSIAKGWTYLNGDWYYMDRYGEAYADCFVDRGEDKYFVDQSGRIVRDKFFEWDGSYYYAGVEGKLARNQFRFIEYDAAKAANAEYGIYYFGDNYKCYRRTGSTFKRVIDGNTYAFDENGLIVTGWMDEEGNKIENPEGWLYDGVYYAGDDGIILMNKWYDFAKDMGLYEFDNDETSLGSTDYDYLDRMWMYFDKEGKKVRAASGDAEKKKNINDRDYAFDEYGVMLTFFSKTGGLDTHQKSNPTSLKSANVYADTTDGSLNKEKWLWLYPSKELDSTEYKDEEMHWWYADKNGNLYRNKLKEIGGKKYVFDGVGRLKAGFVLFDGGKEYVANYMPEDLCREDFLYTYDSGSHLYGHELSDLRYFGDDDKLDGSMRTGELQIELSDGTYTFGFNASGIAYGNRNQLRKQKNVYYINGLKLTALEDMKYGIIKMEGDEYKLVDSNGKTKRGNRKVIIDDEGNYILMMNNDVVGYKLACDMPSDDVVIKWKNAKKDEPAGFYYFDKAAKSGVDKYHYGMCQASTVYRLSADDKNNIVKDMKVNFK